MGVSALRVAFRLPALGELKVFDRLHSGGAGGVAFRLPALGELKVSTEKEALEEIGVGCFQTPGVGRAERLRVPTPLLILDGVAFRLPALGELKVNYSSIIHPFINGCFQTPGVGRAERGDRPKWSASCWVAFRLPALGELKASPRPDDNAHTVVAYRRPALGELKATTV